MDGRTTAEFLEGQSHFCGGCGLDMAHVGFDDWPRFTLDQLPQLIGSRVVGGDLSGDIGQIVIDGPRWIRTCGQ